MCVIGNKIDLEQERVVKMPEVRALAEEHEMGWQEGSALENIGIEVSWLCDRRRRLEMLCRGARVGITRLAGS
jgi:hypothetical protein